MQESAAPQPDPDFVRAELDRILASHLFSSAPRQSNFLRFVVNRTLEGRKDDIKEFVIATEIYGRGSTYDPQVDSIVRVEASRIRQKLRDYYAGEGKSNPVRLQIPRGSYVPEFEFVEAPSVAELVEAPPEAVHPVRPRRALPTYVWLAGCAVALAVLVWLVMKRATAPPDRIAGIAVLPFVSLGASVDDERFADGLTEEITTRMAQLPGMRVPARTTMYQFKGRSADIQKVGRDAKVDAVLEGSVRRQGSRYLVTAQLIKVGDGYHLWAETFERESADSLKLQQEFANDIAGPIAKRIQGELQWRSQGREPLNAAALSAYSRAQQLMNQDFSLRRNENAVPPQLLEAISLLEEATRITPGSAQLWSSLAAACERAIELEPGGATQMQQRALNAAQRAIELDPTLAEAHAIIGTIRLYKDWDWPAAERHLRRAIELDPRRPVTRREYSDLLRLRGDAQGALEEIRRAQHLNPESAVLDVQMGNLLYAAGRYQEAIAEAQRALQRRSDSREAHWLIGICLQELGELREAETKFRQILSMAPKDGRALPALGHVLGRQGRIKEAQAVAGEIHQLTLQGKGMEYPLAMVYAGMGDKDRAFEWLDKAFEKRDPSLIYIKVAARMAPLRSDPRYAELLERLRLE
jgi:TolB-like protein/Flp pilus assembly protein TadD